MAHTPVTVALLRALRREHGRPFRENAADIGIHRAGREHRVTPSATCREAQRSTTRPKVSCILGDALHVCPKPGPSQ